MGVFVCNALAIQYGLVVKSSVSVKITLENALIILDTVLLSPSSKQSRLHRTMILRITITLLLFREQISDFVLPLRRQFY